MRERPNFDECYAKVVLETLLPGSFACLEVGDKPDLRDLTNDIGIEVVGANKTEDMMAWSLLNKLANSMHNGIEDEKAKDSLRALGGDVSSFPFSYERKTSISDVLSAFEKKVGKLNKKQYKVHSRYDLFIYTYATLNDGAIDGLGSEFSARNTGELVYTRVYLLRPGVMGVYDLAKDTYEKIPLPISTLDIATRAKEIYENSQKPS